MGGRNAAKIVQYFRDVWNTYTYCHLCFLLHFNEVKKIDCIRCTFSSVYQPYMGQLGVLFMLSSQPCWCAKGKKRIIH